MAGSGASFSGLASGIDSSTLIASLVNVAKRPMTRIVSAQDALKAQSKKFSTLKNNLTDLSNAAEALRTSTSVLTSKGTSANEKVVKVSTKDGAATGSYAIHVSKLATTERTYSNGFASKTTPGLFGTGTFDLTIGGDTSTITVDANDTLESLVSKINASGAAAKAATFFDGTNWRLSVTGTNTGASGAISFVENGTALGLDNPANQAVAAQDAEFSIDGFAMTSASNTITTAIDKTTLTLVGTSDSPLDPTDTTAISVERDSSAIISKLKTFVGAYNAVQNFISAESAFVGVQKGPESLTGDSTLRALQSQLRAALGTKLDDASPYTNLAMVGLETQRDGTLKLDETKFSAAFADDADKVAKLLSQDGTKDDVGGTYDGLMELVTNTIDAYTSSTDGILTTRINSLSKRVRGMDDQLSSMQRRVDQYEQQLKTRYAKLEETIGQLSSQGQSMAGALSGLR